MDLGLRDKAVIITGAAQGIGAAAARAFAAEGARVAVVDLTDPSPVAKEIVDGGGSALSFVADVSESAQVKNIVDAVLAEWGRIDVLVNNAGVLRGAYVVKTEESLWDFVMKVNLKSVFLFSKAVAPTMMAQRGGCIINASSMAAVTPAAAGSAYAASKAGVASLTKTLAGELGPYNIRVVAYQPSIVDTPMIADIRKRGVNEVLKTVPLGRLATAEDIGNVIVLLASEPAGYISGALIQIAGAKGAIQNVAVAQARAGLKFD